MLKNPPEGMHRITPYVFYNDVAKAVEWLETAFGFEKTMVMPDPEGKVVHAEMKLQDAGIMMGLASEQQGSKSPKDTTGVTQSLYVYVDDLESHIQHAKSSGATITSEITEMFWGDKMYTANDLEGQHWTFAQHVKDIAPEDMKPDFS
ncbi:MAG: VOC family protein [Ectothiorhodospiraceae bacterium]|nr:VOC family protein [Ectothiorhodospiraceae bacterium]